MSLEQLANIAEVFGMIVVAITLIFLTVQMRQNTKMLRSGATQGAHDQLANIYQPLVTDPSLTDLFWKGMEDPSKLSVVEKGRFFAFWLNAFYIYQNWYFQTREGHMDEVLLNAWGRLLTDMYQTAGLKVFWEQRKYVFAPDFVHYLDNDVYVRSPTPGYRVFDADAE
jgi:hypothetical protein